MEMCKRAGWGGVDLRWDVDYFAGVNQYAMEMLLKFTGDVRDRIHVGKLAEAIHKVGGEGGSKEVIAHLLARTLGPTGEDGTVGGFTRGTSQGRLDCSVIMRRANRLPQSMDRVKTWESLSMEMESLPVTGTERMGRYIRGGEKFVVLTTLKGKPVHQGEERARTHSEEP